MSPSCQRTANHANTRAKATTTIKIARAEAVLESSITVECATIFYRKNSPIFATT